MRGSEQKSSMAIFGAGGSDAQPAAPANSKAIVALVRKGDIGCVLFSIVYSRCVLSEDYGDFGQKNGRAW
jgi:hypothetical protein